MNIRSLLGAGFWIVWNLPYKFKLNGAVVKAFLSFVIRATRDHLNTRIPQTLVSGIPLILGLGTRMSDPDGKCGLLGPLQLTVNTKSTTHGPACRPLPAGANSSAFVWQQNIATKSNFAAMMPLLRTSAMQKIVAFVQRSVGPLMAYRIRQRALVLFSPCVRPGGNAPLQSRVVQHPGTCIGGRHKNYCQMLRVKPNGCGSLKRLE